MDWYRQRGKAVAEHGYSASLKDYLSKLEETKQETKKETGTPEPVTV
jgi:hypothetical protein